MEDVLNKFVPAMIAEDKYYEKLEKEAEPQVSKELLERAERLAALGFSKTPEVRRASEEYHRTYEAHSRLEKRAELMKKYPSKKIINEEAFMKVLEENDLIWGSLDSFIGIVPEKNLQRIIDFVEKTGIERTELKIAAIKEDFKLEKGQFIDKKTRQVIDDPIVFLKETFNFHDYFIVIIDAWGPEAEIPEVFNELNN